MRLISEHDVGAMKYLPLALLLSITGLFAQSPTLAPLPPDGFVTLTQVVSDFSSQPQAALQKYQGQRIFVYGRVGQVAQSDDAAGNPLNVFLQLADNPTPDVKCVFTQADIPEWGQGAQLQISSDDNQAVMFHRNREGNVGTEKPFVVEGQTVGIRGTFDNFVAGDVVLKDCNKETPEKLMKVLKEHGISTE